MSPKPITVSADFRRKATKATFSLVLFGFTYLLLVGLAVALTIGCAYGGMLLVILKPMFITLMVGLGLISMGILVLVFLLKFILSKHSIDRSHLVQVHQEDEPTLFDFIAEVVKEARTAFPKRIYLSSDVNASVFYDSSFWSMFFPVRKNLQIGVGLVNTVTLLELKAILAHEFGHFSQRSMKVGSYVYHVNHIIYNLLYENDSYESLVSKWANASGFFTLFVGLAVKLVQGIQWVLRKHYESINLTYLGLSREMEFHADEVAANVTGAQPLVASLLRLELANYALDGVVNYYNERIPDGVISRNVYPQQKRLMNFLAAKSNLPIKQGFPVVTLAQVKRYNKSKLVIVNQWASHPSINERIAALNELHVAREKETYTPASYVFSDVQGIQQKITSHLFSLVELPDEVTYEGEKEFMDAYVKRSKAHAFHEIFNGYYDHKSPGTTDGKESPIEVVGNSNESVEDLFGDDKVDLIYSSIALENDRGVLIGLLAGNHQIQSFDYDGVKYPVKDTQQVVDQLAVELVEYKEQIILNDCQIYSCFMKLAKELGQENAYSAVYRAFQKQDVAYESRYSAYTGILRATHFMQYKLPVTEIEMKIKKLLNVEKTFKMQLADLMGQPGYIKVLTPQIKEHFLEYLSKDWRYFHVDEYDSYAVGVMYMALQGYAEVLSNAYFIAKKTLLDFKAQLLLTKKIPL